MAKRQFRIGDRVRLRDGSAGATIFANPYTFKGERQVAVTWDHRPKLVLTIEVSRIKLVARRPALRFKVGDRVICARGMAIGSTGCVARRVVSKGPNRPLSRTPDWVVQLDEPCQLSSGSVMEEVWFDDDELEPWTVPLEARPVAVGALHHSEARRG